ncbi:MAG: metallophosphoesterase [Pyrobaculum arsenaticum]|uniref:Metallophosphoesterase n=2 Tax=Pyrobaculum arsenaticum TaxID=121277 RepID=A4WM43_PYRAR|nr:metallophosphoesterase [Pyrobaculum arsenaticum]ABP51460.1 metallophosphoesterase [Pyrobaculum arsenaticum DSM 13514]MCY0890936.1 metallophosphoesterase [Pyrobaculum arsenaticum]NYR16572.1 metallophosphoesterase [Pyrobaculum arsenaticum]
MRGLLLSVRRERILLLADTHVGYEVELRRERGVHAMSQTGRLVEKILELVDNYDATAVAILGDVKHELPIPRESAEEIKNFLKVLSRRAPVLITPGNHDSLLQEIAAGIDGVEIAPARGVLLGKYLLFHGHVKPAKEDLEKAEVVIMGHTHPAVIITDDIGYAVKEPAVLKINTSRSKVCRALYGEPCKKRGKLKVVVLPASHPLITGVDVREIPQMIAEGRTFLKYVELKPEDVEIYLTDFTFIGTLADVINVAQRTQH